MYIHVHIYMYTYVHHIIIYNEIKQYTDINIAMLILTQLTDFVLDKLKLLDWMITIVCN